MLALRIERATGNEQPEIRSENSRPCLIEQPSPLARVPRRRVSLAQDAFFFALRRAAHTERVIRERILERRFIDVQKFTCKTLGHQLIT